MSTNEPKQEKPCPNCGYCPTCGRAPTQPYVPYISPGIAPWDERPVCPPTQPFEITWGSATVTTRD
jgi:hypothetical protein